LQSTMNADTDKLKAWLGRRESTSDIATAWPVDALNATLDRREAKVAEGDTIPAGWHWLYFLETHPASALDADGHARRGGFLPPVELPRRMWAGGRLDFRRLLRVGERLTR